MSNDLKTTMPNFTALMERATAGPYHLGTKTETGIYNPNYLSAGDENATIASIWGIPLHSRLDKIRDDPIWQEGLANAAALVLARNNVQVLVDTLARCAQFIRNEGYNYSSTASEAEALLAAIEEQAGGGE